MMRRVLSLLWWAFLVVTCILLFPVALVIWAVTAPFDRQLRVLHLFTCWWASLYSWINPAWTVRIEGRERIRPGATYVMIANHQSFADILVLFRLFAHFKWVSKVEIFRLPFIGWNMVLNRYVALRRGDRSSVAAMMRACASRLEEGSSIMIFPEGTRSTDGRLKAFKAGAFTLAKRGEVPILPIVVEGTAKALPRRGFVLRGRQDIRVRVLDEVPYATFAELSVEELTHRMHALFRDALGACEDASGRVVAGLGQAAGINAG
jgi:1-acyl-sn-glycerol-3-phosphate acyltransferase